MSDDMTNQHKEARSRSARRGKAVRRKWHRKGPKCRGRVNRRSMLKSSLALMAGGAVAPLATAEPEVKNVNTASSPSTLKITDMRYAVVVKPGPSPCVIIRIDTNQGVSRTGRSARYRRAAVRHGAEEPPRWARTRCSIDYLFQKIAQFGGNARQAGGVCAVEMALWDIAGKVYNIPVYQMLGGKWRDQDSHLRGYDGVGGPCRVWPPRERAQGQRADVDEDGSRHQRSRGNARHRDAAARA